MNYMIFVINNNGNAKDAEGIKIGTNRKNNRKEGATKETKLK